MSGHLHELSRKELGSYLFLFVGLLRGGPRGGGSLIFPTFGPQNHEK